MLPLFAIGEAERIRDLQTEAVGVYGRLTRVLQWGLLQFFR